MKTPEEVLEMANKSAERAEDQSIDLFLRSRTDFDTAASRSFITKLIKDWQRLRLALSNYGDMHHLMGLDDWEVPSGEVGILCPTEHINPEHCTDMVEDGSVARYALNLSDKVWAE